MDFTPSQTVRLEALLDAGFRFVSFDRFERHAGVERDGFAVLLDFDGGEVRAFSQMGYLIDNGIAMLVERGAGKAFVWHDRAVEATPELLASYERFRADLHRALGRD